MTAVKVEQLGVEAGDDVLTIMRMVWQQTYIDTELLPQEILAEELPITKERSARQQHNLERQDDEGDETMPRYYGAFDEEDVLVGFIKIVKPLKDLNRYSGKESFRQQLSRKLLRRKPELIDSELGEIVELNVLPSHQKQGIGTALVNHAIDKIDPSINRMRLFAQLSTHPFFRRFGFKPNSERSFYPQAGNEAHVSLIGMSAKVNELRKVA